MVLLYVALSAAELLGPDMKKEAEKTDDENEISEALNTNPKADSEYIKELTDAVNKEIVTLQEYADALKKSKEHKDDKEPNKGSTFYLLLYRIASRRSFMILQSFLSRKRFPNS